MKDNNGNEIRKGEPVALLCEVIAVEANGVVIKILNSPLYQMLVSAKFDEVAGDLVASSELIAFAKDKEAA